MLTRIIILAIILLSSIEFARANDSMYQKLPYDMLNIIAKKTKTNKIIKVAIVDDGFRLSHKDLKSYIYHNDKEIPNNFRDDDNNGYIDDVNGWDVSDKDNNVSIIAGRENEFMHGTYIASIIIKVFEKFYGDDASKYLRIIPVKVLADDSKTTYLEDGYKGIEYASKTDADIICCAWSGGTFGRDEQAIIDEALKKDQIIVSSVGNFFTEDVNYPANYNGIIAVSAVDTNYQKIRRANYNIRVNISAPGDSIFGAHPAADNSYFFSHGTSPATAMIAGCIAILKSISKTNDNELIRDALFLTATPIDEYNSTYAGKLGSGFPNIEKAVEYIDNPKFRINYFDEKLPKGKVIFSKGKTNNSVKINPVGEYLGLHIIPSKVKNNSKLKIYSKDSIYFNGKTSDFRSSLYINRKDVTIESQPIKNNNNTELLYYMQAIDSTKLYCSEVVYLNNDSGIIKDGSGDFDYANKSVCKWIITVAQGKRIKLDFTKMNTEPNIDYVYIYDGETSLKENLLAQFSGSNKPPIIISNTNKVMVWFLSNDYVTSDGWELNYQAVE